MHRVAWSLTFNMHNLYVSLYHMVSDNDILVRKPYPVHLPKIHKGIFLKERGREK